MFSQELYVELRSGLVERLHDKESLIRAQSIVGLSKIAMSEDPTELNEEEDELPAITYMLSCLSTDPAAYVQCI